MVKIFQKTVKGRTLETLSVLKAGSWVYVEEPTETEFTALEEMLGLDAELLTDALDPFEVPRSETYGDILYVYARVPYRSTEGRTFTLPLLVAVGEQFICTVAKKQYPIFDAFLSEDVAFSTTQQTKFILQLFGTINASYEAHMHDVSRRVRESSSKVERITEREIAQSVSQEEILNDFLASLVPLNVMLAKLLDGKHLTRYEEDEDLIEDILLDNHQLIETAKAHLKTLQNIREAHSTIMTHQLNRVIKLLTALTIILTVPTLIASIYGMNVRIPFADSPFAFHGIIVGVLVISLILLGVFNRNRWL